MAPRESVFTGSSPSLADITNAIEKIETLLAAKMLKKKLMYDMLLGFRTLEQALQQKQTDAYGLITKWLRLFLKIQSSISIQDEVLRGHFEKVVPSAVTYMIGCLQGKPTGIISYHYELLEMIHELLSNVRPEVLEKLASFETGIIACVWFPIDFVGDFNTQMMALRLLVMLLKCVDATRLESELDKIRCGNKSVLKDKMTAAIAVANFHAAKFENTARELLNTYNMHFAQHILVYSFRCKAFKFGDNIEFYKPMNADNFWVDFNYSPRTLSFNGQCLVYNQSTYTTCSVHLQIEKLSISKKPNTSDTTVKKLKKVNEVKPMVLSNKTLENTKNRPFNDITANVQNTQNVTTIDITGSDTSNLGPDIYDDLTVSDAEPGQSYRNFKTRRSSNEQLENGPEFKRSRKSLPRAVKKDTCRLESSTLASRTIKPGVKRMSPDLIYKDPFDALREIPIPRSKDRKLEATTAKDSNLSFHSPAIEVDITTKQNIIETIVAQGCTAYKQTAPKINNNNFNMTTTPSTQLNPSNINIEEVIVNKSHAIPPISTEIMKLSKTQIDDIEECRRDVGHNGISFFNESDEFSDFPTFPNLMNISDMLSLNECESTKNRINKTTATNPTDTDLNSPTKRNLNTDLPVKKSTRNILESHNNLIYYSRSESDSDNDDSITLNNTLQQRTTKSPEHLFLTPQIPLERCQKTTKSLTKCHVTTTGTSIITQQDRFVHHQLVNLTTSLNTPLNLSKSCTRATLKTTTKTVVKETNDISLNSFMQRSLNIRTPTPKALRQESSSMITNYTNNLNIQFDRINNDVSKNCANSYIQKTCDIAERMMNEIERERVSLLELQANVERLSRQLSWQYEAYQRKSQQFECFKQNIETLFNALKNINILEEIKNDTQRQLLELQQASESIATQQWRDFINESTENLLRDISSLSNL